MDDTMTETAPERILLQSTPNTHPILFSAPMVKALLDGRKTQTRRIMKVDIGRTPSPGAYFHAYNNGPQWNWWTYGGLVHNNAPIIRCPYGRPGSLLWVRESIAYYDKAGPLETFIYRADGTPDSNDYIRWTPSIHMPRRASRLTLELTVLRVERLQDISTPDAIAEGVEWRGIGQAIPAFKRLWESINGYGSWSTNPWVWALSFKVHVCNVDKFAESNV